MDRIFRSADILIPKSQYMGKWSVIACDQFTSQPEYWDELEKWVGDAPSSLKLMLPEAWLDSRDQLAETEKINSNMLRYMEDGIFITLPDSYIYLERSLPGGKLRRGLIGVIDLEAYDYRPDSTSLVRATEGTVEERLPPRVRVRKGASLEMPHIMVFIDDSENNVIRPIGERTELLPKVYDTELCMGGGHVRGWQLRGKDARELELAIDGLFDAQRLKKKYGENSAPAVFAMGDGNHSLATAKKCWEELRQTLSPEERKNHPARFGMVELVNIHDDAVEFEPIHKVLFNTRNDSFISQAEAFWMAQKGSNDTCHRIRLVTGSGDRTVEVRGLTLGQLIGRAEEFCQSYLAANGGRIDYIHNDDTALELGRRDGCGAMLLPRLEKNELFPGIISSGPFPKKSFSIGHAKDKRYYLECRKIK